MTKSNHITLTLNGMQYMANEAMTSCWKWPKGCKGQRVRIKKAEFEAARQQKNNEIWPTR